MNKTFFFQVDFHSQSDNSEEADDNYAKHIYYHRFGEPQKSDNFIAEIPGDINLLKSKVSNCGRYLIVSLRNDDYNTLIFVADLEKNHEINEQISLTPIISTYDAEYLVSHKIY